MGNNTNTENDIWNDQTDGYTNQNANGVSDFDEYLNSFAEEDSLQPEVIPADGPEIDEFDDWNSVTGLNTWQLRDSPMGNSGAYDAVLNNKSVGSSSSDVPKTPFKRRTKKTLPAEKDTFKENVFTVIIAIFIAMIVRTVWVEPFTIPSGSMLPTLQIGDYVFVSKPSYGYSRYSLPFGMPLIKERINYTEPEVGDVAVFKLPSNPSINYIKRIIGLPGDSIQVVSGRLIINGKKVEREEIGSDVVMVSDGKLRAVTEYTETLPNGKKHSIFEISDREAFDNTKVFQVPYGYFFVMGDNRDNSLDSRSDNVGYVPVENLVGKARYIFFSKKPEFSWLKFWEWAPNVRLDRIGSEVE